MVICESLLFVSEVCMEPEGSMNSLTIPFQSSSATCQMVPQQVLRLPELQPGEQMSQVVSPIITIVYV